MTVLMSVGFHDYVAFLTSLALQWGDKAPAPETLGRLIQVKAAASIVTYSGVWLVFDFFGGSAALALVVFCIVAYSRFPERVVQNKNLALLSRYRLYSALTFMLGTQCQIFIIFARFLIVEKFGYSVSAIATLYLLNATAGMALNVPHNSSRGNEVIVGRAGAAIPAETAPHYVSLGLDFQDRFPT